MQHPAGLSARRTKGEPAVEKLPAAFEDRMKKLLGEEYGRYLEAMGTPPRRTVRLNTLKCPPERFAPLAPFARFDLPFDPAGFTLVSSVAGRHPWHHAGLFYFQEASAMAPVAVLDPKPGMRVLDLCAAPGGKSTQIASRLCGEGLLVSNEIVPARAKILLSNLERCGVRNALVTNEKPETLCARLPGYFDRVLVDAPCSGEGMFRREPAAAAEWTPETPAACARRQTAILGSAKDCVRAGGVLVYSTCTFSPEENEGVVDAFLRANSDFVLEDIGAQHSFGRPGMPQAAGALPVLEGARRIFPQDGGEGHFVARMRRVSGGEGAEPPAFGPSADPAALRLFRAFWDGQFSQAPYGVPAAAGDSLYLLPESLPDFARLRLRTLRAGVFAGRIKKGRFEPEHALYLAAAPASLRRVCDFSLDSPLLRRFLLGEELEAPAGAPDGYTAVCAQGFPVGFGKVAAGRLKNHLPRGLRNLPAAPDEK